MLYQEQKENQVQAVKQYYSHCQRWDAVIICSLILTGSSYCMQEFPSTHDNLQSYFLKQGVNEFQFEYYYNLAQSISLGILIFIAGFIGMLSDMLQPGIILIVQTFLLVLGQFMVHYSIYSYNFKLLIIGRIILFVQCSSMFISIKVFINNHSSEKRKGLSLGIMTTGGSLAFGINLLTEPQIAQKYGLRVATFTNLLIASVCFIFAFMCYYIEQNTNQQIECDFIKVEEQIFQSYYIQNETNIKTLIKQLL